MDRYIVGKDDKGQFFAALEDSETGKIITTTALQVGSLRELGEGIALTVKDKSWSVKDARPWGMGNGSFQNLFQIIINECKID